MARRKSRGRAAATSSRTSDDAAIAEATSAFEFDDTEAMETPGRPGGPRSTPRGSARGKRLARALESSTTPPAKRPRTVNGFTTPSTTRSKTATPVKAAALAKVKTTPKTKTPSGSRTPSRGRPPAKGRPPGRKKVPTDDTDADNAIARPAKGVVARPRSYFDAHRAGVNRTSNCTLADLCLPSAEAMLAALEKACDPLVEERAAEMRKISSDRRIQQLLFLLHAGHSLLFFGFGSKRAMLSVIADALSENYDVVEICGFNPSLSVRSALTKITDEVLQIKDSYSKRNLQNYINAVAKHIGNRHIAVVVHNIDGTSLRSSDVQRALADLSAIPNVLFAASVDHVNAPLLWNGTTWATFAWAWVNVNTFAFYDAETVYASKSMLQGASERRVEGAVILLNSLSANARKVFEELARRQVGPLEGVTGDDAVALPRTTFNNLFESCRRSFICTDTSSLRSILTELETHDMLERRRGADAEEQIWVPLSVEQLKTVLSQMDK